MLMTNESRHPAKQEGTSLRWLEKRYLHWTAILSVVLGLLDLLLIGCDWIFFSGIFIHESVVAVALPNAFWDEWGSTIDTALAAGGVYALVGWILGLIAFQVARRPAWRRGLVLAAWGLGFHLVSLVGMALYVISSLSILSTMHSGM